MVTFRCTMMSSSTFVVVISSLLKSFMAFSSVASDAVTSWVRGEKEEADVNDDWMLVDVPWSEPLFVSEFAKDDGAGGGVLNELV